MTRPVKLVTDSNSQIPDELARRFGVAVVPLPVTVDGTTHLEGVDLDTDEFYARLAAGPPAVATAQPSPGQFVATYSEAVAAGAGSILSVHIGSAVSGTVNSAQIAARAVDVAVRIVDTGTASFSVALSAWAAGEALAGGADLAEAAGVAEAAAAGGGNVFVVGGLELARAGGRLAAGAADEEGAIPVLSMRAGTMEVLDRAADSYEAARVMADAVRSGGFDLRVGVGVADREAAPLGEAVIALLDGVPEVREVVRYRVGPSVGVHTGPGTVGVMWASW